MPLYGIKLLVLYDKIDNISGLTGQNEPIRVFVTQHYLIYNYWISFSFRSIL